MNVFISRRAGLAATRINARWREHADFPSTFAQELLEAIDFLGSVDTPGTPFPTEKRPGLKRLLMPKSRCHIYFEIDERKQMIRVLHVWDGRRETTPKL